MAAPHRAAVAAMLASALVQSCAGQLHAGPAPDLGESPLVFGMYRSACGGGFCKSYRIVVRANGLLEFEGLECIATRGRRWARIDSSQVEALARLDVPDDPKGRPASSLLERTCAIDVPTVSIVQTVSGSGRGLCRNALEVERRKPETQKILELEAQALRIMNGTAWVKFAYED